MRLLALTLCLLATTSCATLFGGAAVRPNAQPFSGFPPAFTALQVVTAGLPDGDKTVLASLRRDAQGYHVTFLHPAFQTPLLELKTYGPEAERTRYFVDKERLPFAPRMILDAIVALYAAKDFVVASNPGEPLVLSLHTDTVDYRLAGFDAFPACYFPGRIELAFNASTASTPQVLPRLRVETKDLECK
jgi:hypothetical protein